jgi:ADP-ribose pyrophosphatase
MYRWKRNENGDLVLDSITKKPILKFVAIQRRDTKEWAIPGVKF